MAVVCRTPLDRPETTGWRALRSCRGPSRDSGSPFDVSSLARDTVDLVQSPAPEPDSREATVSSRGFVPVEYRSAGLERSPLAVLTGHGVFLDAPDSRNGSREFLSWSSAPLQSSSVPHPPVLLHRYDPRKREPDRSGNPGPPLLGFLPLRTQLRRVPLLVPPRLRERSGCPGRLGDRSEPGEGRQPLAGAVLRVLAPLDGSGTFAARARPLAGSRVVCRDNPTLRGLVPCRSRPWSALQSFLFPGSRTRSRGPLLPCGFAFDHRQRGSGPASRDRFPRRASSLPDAPACAGTHDAGAGTTVPRDR